MWMRETRDCSRGARRFRRAARRKRWTPRRRQHAKQGFKLNGRPFSLMALISRRFRRQASLTLVQNTASKHHEDLQLRHYTGGIRLHHLNWLNNTRFGTRERRILLNSASLQPRVAHRQRRLCPQFCRPGSWLSRSAGSHSPNALAEFGSKRMQLL